MENKKIELKKQIREIAINLHKNGIYPSRNRVWEKIGNPPIKSFILGNLYLKELRAELGIATR